MKCFLIIPILLLFACNKQQEEKQEQRYGGLLPDNEKAVAKVPLIVSKGFADSVSAKIAHTASRGKPDKTAPKVSFEFPLNQSIVSGIVAIKVSASDNVGVTGLVISIDGSVVYVRNGLAITSASYEWNTDNETKGYHTITAVAKDAEGKQASASVVVFIETIIIVPDPPSETGVSLTMPPVMNQGSEGSCAAAAIGHAARGAEWYYKTGESKTFSVEFLYNQVKFSTDCSVGTAMQTCLDLMVSKGICTNALMPYSYTNGCALLPNESQFTEALQYRIDGYYKIYCTDHAAIKSMIDQKHPVIINVIADNSFIAAKAGFVWRTYSGSGSLPHCIVICGYDDSKNAYKIMNSWGTGWCDSGFGWIDYDFFLTITGTYCYAIK